MKIKKIAQTPGLVATVVDNLNSDSDKNALSARQGKQLKKMIDDIEINGGSGGGSGTTTIINDALPIGSIVPYTSSTIPDNWFICEGQTISRTEYSELFEVIGTTYGTGDGRTTFNLPNLKGRVPAGRDSTDSNFDVLGETGGEKAHNHTLENGYAKIIDNGQGKFILNAKQASWVSTGQIQTSHISTTYSSTDESWAINLGGETDNSNNLQPYIILNYIIKAKETKTSGGIGTPEIAIGSEEPTGEEVLWIDDDSLEAEDIEDIDVIVDKIYPVGSVYITVNDVSPSILFGGKWERISQGRFLIGVKENSAFAENNIPDFGTTAGNKGYLFAPEDKGGEYKNTLEFENYSSYVYNTMQDYGENDLNAYWNPPGGSWGLGSIYTKNKNIPHNNMPPYFAAYMWKRIA